MTQTNKICVGVIMGAHGIKGDVRLRSFTDDPAAIGGYQPITDETGNRVFAIRLKGAAPDHFIATIKGLKDRSEAEALRGTKLYVDRAALPAPDKAEYYEADLIGLNAVDDGGKRYGVVKAVYDHGAGAFLEIQPHAAKSFMLPFKDAFVPLVDIAAGTITVAVPEGWLTEAKPPKPPKKPAPS